VSERERRSGEPQLGAGQVAVSGERAAPFYCPYCGEEDLRPAEEPAGAWCCGSCLRTFSLRLNRIGVAK
jgi:ribosomal protein L37AE/L43A